MDARCCHPDQLCGRASVDAWHRTRRSAVRHQASHTHRKARGGSGALTDLSHRSFVAAGGQTLTSAQVVRLETCNQQVTGVSLADGRRIDARCVLVSSDPQKIFTEWLNDPALADRTPIKGGKRSSSRWLRIKLDLVIDGLPVYKFEDRLRRAVGDSDLHTPTTVIAPTPSDLEEAHQRRSEGEIATRPSLLINIPTNLDRSMQLDASEHVLSLEVLFTPYTHNWASTSEPERWLEYSTHCANQGHFVSNVGVQ